MICVIVVLLSYSGCVITGNFGFNGYNEKLQPYCFDWANFPEYWPRFSSKKREYTKSGKSTCNEAFAIKLW